MEAFSLLKYWRGTAAGAGFVTGVDGGATLRNTTTTTTIVTAVSTHHAAEETDDDDDDGPFFDLEFAVQDQDDEAEEDEDEDDGEEQVVSRNNGGENDDVGSEDEITDEEGEFNFTISSNSSGNDRTDQHLTLSPSDDLFFKGKLVPIEPSSLVFNSAAEPNSKPQFPVSLLKSATKFRVSMLGFKKTKQNATEKVSEKNNGSVDATAAAVSDTPPPPPPPKQRQQQLKQEAEKDKQSKFFTVKFKVEEVPIMSLFTRDNNSSRKSQKHNAEDSEEKKFSKDVMQKYLKKVKPLYVRVSKLKFSGQLNSGAVTKSVQSTPSTAGQKPNQPKSTAEKSPLPDAEVAGETFVQLKSQRQANIPERLKVVCKHLGKSRSASSAVAAAPAGVVTSRRDDSLLQQQDGIQSAILHCKRSFNASRDSESSLLARSVSDPSHQKFDLSRKSSDQGKDGSFEP